MLTLFRMRRPRGIFLKVLGCEPREQRGGRRRGRERSDREESWGLALHSTGDWLAGHGEWRGNRSAKSWGRNPGSTVGRSTTRIGEGGSARRWNETGCRRDECAARDSGVRLPQSERARGVQVTFNADPDGLFQLLPLILRDDLEVVFPLCHAGHLGRGKLATSLKSLTLEPR